MGVLEELTGNGGQFLFPILTFILGIFKLPREQENEQPNQWKPLKYHILLTWANEVKFLH